jgi:hypothetical protein
MLTIKSKVTFKVAKRCAFISVWTHSSINLATITQVIYRSIISYLATITQAIVLKRKNRGESLL